MLLLWKLLRHHISAAQLLAFFCANLVGMLIVLLALQFYRDVKPMFTGDDGLISNDYLIFSKCISTVGLGTTTFSSGEIADIESQPFTKRVGAFTASQYKVACSAGIGGVANFGTEMYFESVPDHFIDTDRSQWHFAEGDSVVPIVLPRSYLAIYNFGFAQSRSLPKISEGIISMIDMTVVMRGAGQYGRMRGKVVGFTNRLQTILVPQSFLDWSNALYAPNADASPTRLIVEVRNPADDAIARYAKQHGYDIDEDKLRAGKTTYMLRIVSGVIMCVGLLISLLSFLILMLSIYLLVQKNATKLQNLLLIDYSPARVSLPYQLLTIGVNLLVLVLAVLLLMWLRSFYMDMLWAMFPTMKDTSLVPAIVLGCLLTILVSLLNAIAIRRKVMAIWRG